MGSYKLARITSEKSRPCSYLKILKQILRIERQLTILDTDNELILIENGVSENTCRSLKTRLIMKRDSVYYNNNNNENNHACSRLICLIQYLD